MADYPEKFISRMREDLGDEAESFIASFDAPAVKGIRVNPLKISKEEFEKISPVELDGSVPWERNGFYVTGHGIGKTLAHFAGAYYVQEPSAMSAAPKIEAEPGERVLDLCAAPGGKTTQIASYMGGEGVLISNEVDKRRVGALCENIERMGVRNALVTSASPSEMAAAFPFYFDKILVDAPCSGEGMFRKAEDVRYTWRPEMVKKCAARQREILSDADGMLCGGGRFVYSTCTFSREEDEDNIDWFLSSHPEYELLSMEKLYPHKVRGEGHFVAVLKKREGERRDLRAAKPTKETAIKAYREWEEETLNIRMENVYSGAEGKLHVFPAGAPAAAVCGYGVDIRRNNLLGDLLDGGKRFEPSHTLAMRLRPEEARHISVDEETAKSYIAGNPFPSDEKGWRLVVYENLPLGWCKCSGGTAKNRLPKGLRTNL